MQCKALNKMLEKHFFNPDQPRQPQEIQKGKRMASFAAPGRIAALSGYTATYVTRRCAKPRDANSTARQTRYTYFSISFCSD